MSREEDVAAARARHPAGTGRGPRCRHQWDRFVHGAVSGRWSWRCHLCDLVASTADAALDLSVASRASLAVDEFRARRDYDRHMWQAVRLANSGVYS